MWLSPPAQCGCLAGRVKPGLSPVLLGQSKISGQEKHQPEGLVDDHCDL
jgi:hypothetical protein